jgi:hypothetical protein
VGKRAFVSLNRVDCGHVPAAARAPAAMASHANRSTRPFSAALLHGGGGVGQKTRACGSRFSGRPRGRHSSFWFLGDCRHVLMHTATPFGVGQIDLIDVDGQPP